MGVVHRGSIVGAQSERVEFTIHPSDDDELEFGADEVPRLLGRACALLGPQHDVGRFEELLAENALEAAWDALAAAADRAPASGGFWRLLAAAAGQLGSEERMRRAEPHGRG